MGGVREGERNVSENMLVVSLSVITVYVGSWFQNAKKEANGNLT